jgi:dTDP-4-dehydrorhamnose 3,5-epimerase
MKVTATEIPDVVVIEPDVFRDPRGFFMETFHAQKFRSQGLPEAFVQDNQSRSTRGVVRGLHYQLEHPQGKLVRVVNGEVFDVAVDIRKGSPFFGRWVGIVLSDENRKQMYIPPGFAHGMCVLSERADVVYKCTDLYAPGDEYGIAWSDPDIGIQWPQVNHLLSDKDRKNPRLRELKDRLPRYPVD